jgi:hypothetical protein
VVLRGPSCILEGALRFGSALFEEERDRCSIVRERMTHAVNVANIPCKYEEPTELKCALTMDLSDSSGDTTPALHSGMTTFIQRSFFHPLATSRPDEEPWLHEDYGNRKSAEHDLGMIRIREDNLPDDIVCAKLKVKLVISEEGLLSRKPTLQMSCYTHRQSQHPLDGPGSRLAITWEGSNLSNKRMKEVRAQLEEEMKTLQKT